MEPKLEDFVDLINQWGLDRNITAEGGATVMAQMSKMTEEFAEFLATWDSLQVLRLEKERLPLDKYETIKAGLREKLQDDFGDMLVCLIQAMRLANTDMRMCLAKSWADIKDRKGRMENGKFVKESS